MVRSLGGQVEPGNVTQHDIARHAGVSRALVSLALSDSPKVAQDTKKRILTAASELGYVRNISAASLVSQVAPIIGLILPDLANPYFEGLISAIQKDADEPSLLPLIATASNELNREEKIMQSFLELRVTGIISVSPATGTESLSRFGGRIPLVVIGQPDVGPHIDTVSLNEAQAAQLLAHHFAEQGWQRAVYIYDDQAQADRGLILRRHALHAACGEAGLSFSAISAGQSMQSAVSVAMESSPHSTVLIGHNDLIATQILSELRGAGYDVGQQVGVAGYDNTALSHEGNGGFTSISQPLDEISTRAISLVTTRAKRLYGPAQDVVVEPRLIVRSSTAKPL